VRELRDDVERCITFGAGIPLTPAPPEAPVATADTNLPFKVARDRWNRELERSYLTQLLDLHTGNVAAAARGAQLDRMSFYRLLGRRGRRRARRSARCGGSGPGPVGSAGGRRCSSSSHGGRSRDDPIDRAPAFAGPICRLAGYSTPWTARRYGSRNFMSASPRSMRSFRYGFSVS
jgi:hypothetical protein